MLIGAWVANAAVLGTLARLGDALVLGDKLGQLGRGIASLTHKEYTVGGAA